MARPKSWGDDLTDPGVPGPASDATVVGPAPGPSEEPAPGRCAHKPKKQVHLGSVPEAEPLPEKTRVASMDDVLAPESAEKTVMVANPMLGGEEEQVNGADVNPDATMITANPLATGRSKQKRLVGRLVVTEGKEKGRTIELTEGTKVLGRSKDCDVTLLDIQISRRHVEITADHNGVRIVDLGSGNGTFVNDEQVETVNLVHGDEIAVGDHLLRFEEEGPVASALPALVKKGPAPVASRRAPGGPPATAADVVRRARHRRTKGGGKDRRKLLILVGGALVLVAFTGIALGLKKDPAPPEPSGPTPQEEAQSLYLAGMQKFRDGAFQEALASFEAAIEKMPEHREAGRYVSATRREIAARDALSRGNTLLEQKEYDEAREALRQVDPDSLRYQEAQQALSRADQNEARDVVLEAEALLEEDELDDAEAVFRRAMEIIPEYAAAQRGLERVSERREELAQMTTQQRARQARLARARRAQARRQAVARVRRALAPGQQQFDSGDFQRAIDTFTELSHSGNQRVANLARRKAEAVRAFRPAYERGMSAAESRATEQAIDDLSVAERQARVVKTNGRMHREVRQRLADMHHLQGRIAYNSQRYQVAYQNWAQALSMSPQHRYAKQGMEELKQMGERIYLEAYTVRTLNQETAIRKFRQVIAMTPPNFEYHQRSKERLAELER